MTFIRFHQQEQNRREEEIGQARCDSHRASAHAPAGALHRNFASAIRAGVRPNRQTRGTRRATGRHPDSLNPPALPCQIFMAPPTSAPGLCSIVRSSSRPYSLW
jgi:hypothetical protein